MVLCFYSPFYERKGIGKKGFLFQHKSIKGKYRVRIVFSQNAKTPENLHLKSASVKDAFKTKLTSYLLSRGSITEYSYLIPHNRIDLHYLSEFKCTIYREGWYCIFLWLGSLLVRWLLWRKHSSVSYNFLCSTRFFCNSSPKTLRYLGFGCELHGLFRRLQVKQRILSIFSFFTQISLQLYVPFSLSLSL